MPKIRLLAIALGVAVATPAAAKGPPQPLAEWPCETPLPGPLEPDALWPGATTAPDGAWHADSAARELVEFLTAAENSPAMGEIKIASFAEKHGPLQRETALLVISGMVERGNVLRRVLLKGIKDQIIRSHVLAETIAANGSELAAAQQQNSDAGRERAAALSDARQQNLEGLDDANDTAERLCHRLLYDETKLRRLAAALKAHTQ